MGKSQAVSKLILLLFAVLPLIVTAGCGRGDANLPPRAKVTGLVTLDGRPLATGMVMFVPDADRQTNGPPAVGGIDATGHYELTTDRQSSGDGAIIGFHRVRIVASEKPRNSMQSMSPSLIPLKYNDEAKSGLAFEVKANRENVFDLKLSAEP
ncbi:MAG TPA: hypothetical protein VGY55_06105 [Pirellulales bacterium]|jgi:hypothetical protein|nr:hypothetical protein [Pirellulales bacterium]